MTSLMGASTDNPAAVAQRPLIVINKLILKAFNAKKLAVLKFIIANDTVHIFPYDRAILFELNEHGKYKMSAVSGQAQLETQGTLQNQWKTLANGIVDPAKFQELQRESFTEETQPIYDEFIEHHHPTLYWVPITYEDEQLLGLLLELWPTSKKAKPPQEYLDMVASLLIPGYAIAWKNLKRPNLLKYVPLERPQWYLIGLALILSLFIIRIPLRIVAPSEIVPKDPIIIAAPIEGIVERVIVNPGDEVKKEQPLVEYDKKVPFQELKVAEKEVQIMEAEVNRSMTLGLRDPKALAELAILQLKLQKAKVSLDLAKHQASLTTILSPENGVVMISNPEEWRGKPVRIGEKIMSVSDPKNTKVRIWIPESDNIVLNMERPIKVYLNIAPEKGYGAQLIYIANESTVSEKHLPSFIADADWEEQPEDIKLGLKGTAVLYGERVSLFYFLIRKPLAYVRHLVGM